MRKIRIIMCGLLCSMGVLLSGGTVLAGSINGNESSVIGVASGTFEYKGTTYVAKQSYVSQLVARLSKDSVDLSASQAQKAISQIYNNVATGVKSGYLTPVSESDKTTESKDKSDTKDKSEGNQAQGDSEENDSQVDSSQSGTGTTATTGSAIQKKKSILIDTTDIQGGMTAIKMTGNDDIFSQIKSVNRRMLMLSIFFTSILLVVLILLLWRKRRRKKKGLLVPLIGMVVITAGAFMTIQAGITNYNTFSGDRLRDKMVATGYYKSIYQQVEGGVQKLLTTAGIPADSLRDVLTEEKVYRDGKRCLEEKLAKGESDAQPIADTVRNGLNESLKAQGYINVEQQSDALTQVSELVDQEYNEMIDFPYVERMNEEKQARQSTFIITIVLGMIFVVGGTALILYTEKYKHRAIRVLAYSILVAAMGVALAALLMRLQGSTQLIHNIEPRFYQEFFVSYTQENINNTIYVGLGGMVVWLFLGFTVKGMKNSLRR